MFDSWAGFLAERETYTTIGSRLESVFSPAGNGSSVVADEKTMWLIISNLVTNAANYTLPGDKVTLELTVHETGIGIADEDKAQLFETFHQGKNVGEISGTGLGLAVTKQNVEQHGGTITFESQVDVGSSFKVTIPLIPRHASANNAAPIEQ